MDKKARRGVLSTAMLVLVLNTGCEQSRNREIAQRFTAQFEKILEQRKTLDKLEEQGKQYDQQLEKDLQESNATKRVRALGVWVGEYKGILSQARSVADAQTTIIDTLVSDSVKLSGDAGKYAREAMDSLRDDVGLQKRQLDIGEQVIALVESYIGDPGSADLKQIEEFTKTLDDLDTKEKQVFQHAQDAVVRLRAAAGLT